MRISSAIDLAAIFGSPVFWRIFACGQANVLISSEASERPALLTGLSCDVNGICISLRVRRYEAMVVLFTSSCVYKNNIEKKLFTFTCTLLRPNLTKQMFRCNHQANEL